MTDVQHEIEKAAFGSGWVRDGKAWRRMYSDGQPQKPRISPLRKAIRFALRSADMRARIASGVE